MKLNVTVRDGLHILQKHTSSLDVPDLQALAKDYHVSAMPIICRMMIAIAVQRPH
ncbi:hypothetical protein DEU56DRAFT_748577 [Suillus clintonianus]|uniref:uncharacterized protein n=1 Tax=Suillus clintonianus TaxID=1904413 RepID=UPI001B87E891|nr:uncharacterized protein DEU56DRAFT_748577 [Suillus clintonianus]KAG2115508.1 hypothetical protein DEU56DRAFT_748577 [Suillus clintonianus]